MEHADRISLFSNPLHPYTAALLSAVPSVDKARREATKRILIPGDPPDPMNPPKGCRFATRCPLAEARCRETPLPCAKSHPAIAWPATWCRTRPDPGARQVTAAAHVRRLAQALKSPISGATAPPRPGDRS
ncbi:oligopeptide/dipeptide ABC transporter ATP-binding protein [Seohaeicola zhoushanensis]